MNRATRNTALIGIGMVGALAALYALLHTSGALETITDSGALHARVVQLGAWGPAVIVGLMTLAILISPIPSAPIALAAGAAYGHGWGALYVWVGSGLGAVAAFAVSRFVGRDTVQRWFGGRLSIGLIGSQNALMGLVFVSRLLPFISFDIVSYAAGLTVLKFWRFALATAVGIAPASFLIAHFGTEMGSGETDRMVVAALALGALTLVPVAVKLYRDRRRRAKAVGSDQARSAEQPE